MSALSRGKSDGSSRSQSSGNIEGEVGRSVAVAGGVQRAQKQERQKGKGKEEDPRSPFSLLPFPFSLLRPPIVRRPWDRRRRAGGTFFNRGRRSAVRDDESCGS